MANKKISSLPPKATPSQADIIPIVDTQDPNNLTTKKTTIGGVINVVALSSVPVNSKGQPGGVATLDGEAKLPPEQLPGLALTETFKVNSQNAMLALNAQMGDLAIRNDIHTTFVLQGQNPTVLDNWTPIIAPNSQTLVGLTDVADIIPSERAALVFDPVTNQWRAAKLDKLTDGGEF